MVKPNLPEIDFGPHKTSFLLVLLTLVLLLPLWWIVNFKYTEFLLSRQTNQVSGEAAAHSTALASIINSRFSHLMAIKAFADLHRDSSALNREFDDFAGSIYNNTSGVRNFIIAPGGINQYVYPVAGNEAAMGHNLLTDSRPNVRADVERAKTTGLITISGPYELRQGGMGLVARQAVYHQGQFWGIVSMVLDLPPIFAEAGLNHESFDLQLALKNDADGSVFYGSKDMFEQNPVTQTITLAEGSWQLGALPANGWEAGLQPNQFFIKASTFVIVILITMLVYLTANRQIGLAEAVNRRTRQLVNANTVLQHEIAERKLIEQQLAFQARLLDSVQEAIIATDLDDTVIYWNNFAEKMYGLASNHMLGQPFTAAIAAETTPVRQEQITFAIKHGQWRGQFKQVRVNGDMFWVDVVMSLVRNEQGDPIGLIGIDRDVSLLKQFETDLIASEQKYRLLAENSTDVITVVDVNLHISYISPAVQRYFGYTPSELQGLSLDQILTPAASEEARQLYSRLLNNQADDTISTHALKMDYLHPDGAARCFEVVFTPLLDDNDQLLSMLVTLRDITGRQLAEAALRESERRFRDVLENVSMVAIMLNTDGSITFCNKYLLKLTGWQLSEVLGKNWFDNFIPAEIRAGVVDIFTTTVTSGQFPPYHRNAILTRSGEQRIIDWSNTAYSNSQGKITGITSLGTDITEQQQTLEALVESESRHRFISELISDYVYSAVVAPDGSTTTEWISGPFTRITGLPVEAITTQSNIWINHIFPDDREEMNRQVSQVINNQPVVHEYRIITASGKIRWLRDHLKPIWSEEEQRVVRLVGGIKDITEQKQAAVSLQDSLHEKEVMLKEIHHRVKNNLQIITSLLSLQADSIEDIDTRRALFDSRSRVRSMALVHEMLYLSDNLAQVDIDPYFQSVAKNLFSIFQTEQTKAVLQCSIEPIMLNLDTAIPCGLIVNELISNALKHAFPPHFQQPDTPNKIVLQFSRVNTNNLQLLVSDNGIGIPADFNLQTTPSLGLQLVNILTTQLNGRLEVTTQSGTTFKVTFAEPA